VIVCRQQGCLLNNKSGKTGWKFIPPENKSPGFLGAAVPNLSRGGKRSVPGVWGMGRGRLRKAGALQPLGKLF
jgi:hypothetical protein